MMAVRSWAGRKVPRREKLTARSQAATFCDDLLTMAIEAESRAQVLHDRTFFFVIYGTLIASAIRLI